MGYEEEFMRFLQTLISDVERRIRRGHQRLALNSTQGTPTSNAAALKEEKVAMLTERINELVQQAENLGCEGKVEEAQGVMKLCDQLREERKALENSRQMNQTPESEKTMEVCNVCGALLVVGDIQQRIDEHIMGKQHSGYARIRTYVEERKQRKLQTAEEREARLVREKEEREREREREKEKEREEKRKKEKEREKEREHEREKWSSCRSRCHSRRSRSRSRDRKRRSRSRTSRHRHRSGSKEKHKTGRRHRSRSLSSSRSHSSRQPNHRSRRSRSRELKIRSDSKESKYQSRSPDSKTGSPVQEFNKHRSRSRDSKRRSGSKESGHHLQNYERNRRSPSMESKRLSDNNTRTFLHMENEKRGIYNDCDYEQMDEMQYEKYEDGEIPSDSRGDFDSNEETGTRSEGDTK